MIVYAETSAVLAWLLHESNGKLVQEILESAEAVVTAELTLVECDRVLHRAAWVGDITAPAASERRAYLNRKSGTWHFVRFVTEVIERARAPFPAEPIRALDALHLASALVARSTLPELTLLSLDRRVRTCASELGFELQPR